LPEPELAGVIRRTVFERKTAKTIASPAAFSRELARIRATGFAMDNEEHIEGIRCIATPVRDYSGEILASLCVVGPKNHLPQRRLTEIREALAAASADLSARLGHGFTEEMSDRSAGGTSG
jgi:IclR family acetate operon transcriptional repressor